MDGILLEIEVLLCPSRTLCVIVEGQHLAFIIVIRVKVEVESHRDGDRLFVAATDVGLMKGGGNSGQLLIRRIAILGATDFTASFFFASFFSFAFCSFFE